MTQYLERPEDESLRDRAVEHWHVSLELDPDQPKLRSLVDKYRPKEAPPVMTIEHPGK
jgi:hypothetical protein